MVGDGTAKSRLDDDVDWALKSIIELSDRAALSVPVVMPAAVKEEIAGVG